MSQTAFAQSLGQLGPDARRGPRLSLPEAQAYCRGLAETHYENFTVVSWLLPQRLRQHFCNIYAYCRWADDLADETGDAGTSALLLDWWEYQLYDCYDGDPAAIRHPVFVALLETIQEFEIPSQPFRDLISAFRQDQYVTRYQTADEVLDYCTRSANPVGRLILYLGRVHDPDSQCLSDYVCTGLQLANFCQDVANDWDRGRIYLPQETLAEAGYTVQHFERREFSPNFREAMQREVDRAESHLVAGKPLVQRMPQELRFDVSLFIGGGLAILDAIRKRDYNVWATRPALSKFEKLQIAARAWWQSRGAHS